MPVKYKGVPEGYKLRNVKSTTNKVRTEWGKNRFSTAFYAGSATMTGTSTTVVLSVVNANSYVVVMPTQNPSGTKWWVTKANGYFVVRSNTAEGIVVGTTTFDYFVSNARIY